MNEITLDAYEALPSDDNGEGELYKPYSVNKGVGDKVTIFEKKSLGKKHAFRAEVLQYQIVEG